MRSPIIAGSHFHGLDLDDDPEAAPLDMKMWGQVIVRKGLSSLIRRYQILCYVMPGLVPGIHASDIAAGSRFGRVDGRDKPGHDDYILIPPEATE